jgi:molybdate transport system regulatory protein
MNRAAGDGTSAGIAMTELPRPRIRIFFPDGDRLGPGKIDLLEAIGTTGSISAAGRALGMSYRRAWLLVDATNALFDRPAVVASAGGAQGGGAALTEHGRALVAAYRRIEARMRRIVEVELAPFMAPDASQAKGG